MLHVLKALFSTAAQVRHVGRYFRRDPILEQIGADPGAAADMARRGGGRTLELAYAPLETLYADLAAAPWA